MRKGRQQSMCCVTLWKAADLGSRGGEISFMALEVWPCIMVETEVVPSAGHGTVEAS